MKKIHLMLLSLVIALLCLAGCKIQTVDEYNHQKADETSVDDSNEKIVAVKDKKQDAKVDSNQSTKSSENTNSNAQNSNHVKVQKKSEETNNSTKNSGAKNESKSQSAKSGAVSSNQVNTSSKSGTNQYRQKSNSEKSNAKISKKTTNHSSSTEKSSVKTVVAKKQYVTVSIRLDTFKNKSNYEKLQKPLQNEQYVPSNFVILPTTKYEILKENESVWSITLRAIKEHHIHLEYQGSNANYYGSVYIQGINHLYQYDAGNLSGWLYYVNDKKAGVGCSSYQVKNGDHIVWQYTVNGRDTGL